MEIIFELDFASLQNAAKCRFFAHPSAKYCILRTYGKIFLLMFSSFGKYIYELFIALKMLERETRRNSGIYDFMAL